MRSRKYHHQFIALLALVMIIIVIPVEPQPDDEYYCYQFLKGLAPWDPWNLGFLVPCKFEACHPFKGDFEQF